LAKKARRGKFITFEGPEGSGKSTQMGLLLRHLKRCGIPFQITREPGGTQVGEAVRKVLLTRKISSVHPLTELYLYMAARAQLVRDVIGPALLQGKWVLSDRFLDSSIAYQGYGHGVPIAEIRRLGELVTEGIQPDLTILLDLDSRMGLGRVQKRGSKKDRIESKSTSFHARVRKGYLKLARKEPKRFCVVRAALERHEIHRRIQKEVAHFID
jgi:dTMP kinase